MGEIQSTILVDLLLAPSVLFAGLGVYGFLPASYDFRVVNTKGEPVWV